jgi:hypothetical protein
MKLILKDTKFIDLLINLFFILFLALALRYQFFLLTYKQWGDESETIVTAKMIASGYKLYSYIVNLHGPLVFLPGSIIELFGDFGIKVHRVPIAILQIFAIFSIYKSPLFSDNNLRKLYVVIAISIMLLELPKVFGHMYKYQVIAGLLIAIILSQYTLPSLFSQKKQSNRNVILNNALITSLPFLGAIYAPLSIILMGISIKKAYLASCLKGISISLACNILFLLLACSFSGYLLMHFQINASLNIENGNIFNLIKNIKNAVLSSWFQIALFGFLSITFGYLIFLRRIYISAFILFFGILSLLIRGTGFYALPYFYSMLAIPIVLFYKKKITSKYIKILLLFILTILILKISLLINKHDLRKLKAEQIPSFTQFSDFARGVTDKNQKIIAYSFQNYQYILSGRLPASGAFFLLPYIVNFNNGKNYPLANKACEEIASYLPRVMLIDKWNVGDISPWDKYGRCIQEIIDKNYTLIPESNFYIPNNIMFEPLPFDKNGDPSSITLNKKLSQKNNIEIRMIDSNKKIKKIGILFSSFEDISEISFEINLKYREKVKERITFNLSDIGDKRFKYFQLKKPDFYDSAEIIASKKNNLALWEVNSREGIYTCVNYIYQDDKIRFTPRCPYY